MGIVLGKKEYDKTPETVEARFNNLGFSVTIPKGWKDDLSDPAVQAFYKEGGDSPSVQISVSKKVEGTKGWDVTGKQVLQEMIENKTDKEIEIKVTHKNSHTYSISDYFEAENEWARFMTVEKGSRIIFLTIYIKNKPSGQLSKEIDGIFNSVKVFADD